MPREKWSTEIIKAEALKYDSPSDFYKGCEGAYAAARRKGILDDVCTHMVRKNARPYTEDQVREIASQYATTNRFFKEQGGVKDAAQRMGIYDEVTAHMRRLKSSENRGPSPKRKWSADSIRTAALQYTSIKEFRKGNPRAYDAAHRFDVIDDVCAHMVRKIKKFDHAEYSASIADRGIIALTSVARCDIKVLHECTKCDNRWMAQPWRVINELNGCPRCAKGNISGAELDFVNWIEELTGEVKRSDRTIAAPYEVDAYIESHDLAVEFNGSYWHSIKEPDYHLNKTLLCEQKSVRLIHVWEHEKNNPVIRSIVRAALGSHDQVVWARKCEVKTITWSEASSFLTENHIQGAGSPTQLNLALLYGGEIMAVMTFGKPRFKPIEHDWELIRYAVKSNTCVTGGAARLWSKRPKGSVVTYSDRRLFDGSMYGRLGFMRHRESKPSYFYVHRNGEVLNRWSTRREKLPVLLGDKFDPLLSEVKNMLAAGYYRLFDCGTVTWSYRT